MTTKEVYTLTPSIGGSFSFGWKKMFDKFIYLLVIIFIAGIIEGPFRGAFKADEFHFWMVPLVMFGLAWGFLVVPVISFGEDFLFLKAMREEKIDLKELFRGFTTIYGNIILANLIVSALIILGLIMLIIPGIIIACRLAFVPYIVMDQKLDPMQAVEKSWEMTRGHGWKIFFMAIISFFLIIGGIIFCFVGVFISIMWIHSAHASLYQAVLNQDVRNNTIPIIEVHEG
ncbi:MAG: glycerophosphoryl diester phosphodiesterase membrane domain-containing protein [Mariniphaga sp.]|nr:glycerophosphoryl diester phosphodiesterase membrane domain-containing protein [Mariniphaga sp.]